MPLYQKESSCLLCEDELNLHENEPVGGTHFHTNRPFPSSLEPLFQSESKCESFVMVISSSFHMSENSFSFQRLRN